MEGRGRMGEYQAKAGWAEVCSSKGICRKESKISRPFVRDFYRKEMVILLTHEE